MFKPQRRLPAKCALGNIPHSRRRKSQRVQRPHHKSQRCQKPSRQARERLNAKIAHYDKLKEIAAEYGNTDPALLANLFARGVSLEDALKEFAIRSWVTALQAAQRMY